MVVEQKVVLDWLFYALIKIPNLPTVPHMGERGYTVDKKHKLCHCGLHASFGFEKGNPIHCKVHATEEEENVIHKHCHDCGLFAVTRGNKLCSYCNSEARQRETEIAMKHFLDEQKDL